MSDTDADIQTNISRNLPPSLALNYLTLRRALGVIGICLPWSILAFYYLDPGEVELRTSISAYYYSGMRDVFVGSLITIGIFLIAYRGNHAQETKISSWAGLGAILVALCPTERRCFDPTAEFNFFFAQNCDEPILQPVDYFFWPEWLFQPISYFHYLGAALFFLNVARLSFYVFVETTDTAEKLPIGQGGISPEKKASRNFWYKLYARAILVCFVLMLGDLALNFFGYNTEPYKPIFWLEVFAVWLFAAAWFQKGEAMEATLSVFRRKKVT